MKAGEMSLCEAGTINAAQQKASLTAEIDFQRPAGQDMKNNNVALWWRRHRRYQHKVNQQFVTVTSTDVSMLTS